LSPRHVRVLSGDAALTLREGRPDELGPRDEGAAAVTEIHVRDRLHPRILVQMWKRGESDVLRARCHLSDVPITVNGAPVQRGLALPERVRCVESVDLDHGRAHVGVDDHRRPAAAQITTAGVWIAAHPIPLPRGFVAHVRADRLAKDVSQGDVVRDADYAAVAAAVEAAGLRSLAHLVDLALAGDFRGYAVGDLVTWLFDQASAELPAALRAAPGRYPPARLPIWQTLGGARLTTLDLAAADRLRVVDARPSLMLPEFADILLVERVTGDAAGGDGVDPSAFLHITFAGRVESGDAAVARAIAREHGRRRFLARPHPPRLEDGAYLERLSFGEGTSVRGEVGLRAAGSVRPTLLLLLDGCILEEVALPGPMPGLVAVVAAPAHPDEDYTRAARLSSLAGAFLQILAVTERLVASAALHLGPDIQGRPLVREQLLDYVQASLSPTFVEDFLVGVGFARPLARDVVSHLEGGALRPAWGLGDGGVPHPLAGLRVFPVQGGEPLALADLAGIHRRGEPLWWLPAPADDVDRPVLILDPRLRAWIEAALPRSSLSSYVPHLDRLRKERALLGRPPDAIETAPTLVHVPLRHGRIHGTLGVEASAPRSREVVSGHECHVRIFKRSRHLHDASLTTLLPHVLAAANDDDAEVGRREVPPAIVDAVDAALPQLVLAAAHLAAAHLAAAHLAAAATARAPSLAPPLAPSLRALLLALPTAVYPRPELFEAHLRLIRERGSEGAAAPIAAL
ncbi:MAG TPA: hypothetical protein PKW35_18685, partial [Nannocystaceae bacterium]|nr:hypothetical protein [Nannocystaceae bacterium]